MIGFAESQGAIIAALALPTFVGLLIITNFGRIVRPRYLAAFTLGIYFWFFSDTIGDSSYLDVNAGFTGGVTHVVLVALFAVGIVLVFALDRTIFFPGLDSETRRYTGGWGLAIPLLVAFAVGFHGSGEGAAFSVTAATASGTNLIDVFGGLSSAIAFTLHKALEPMMIGATYWVYSGGTRGKSTSTYLRDILLLTLVFTLPGVVGSAIAYYVNYETVFLFAFGLGTSIYAAIRLAKPLFVDANVTQSESVKIVLLILFGFLAIYYAALFHS